MANANAIKMGGGYVQLFTDNSAMVRGLKNARKDFDSWAAGIAKAGAGLAAVGVGMGLPAKAGLDTFKSYSDAILTVKAATGASGREFDRLNSLAQELGKTSGVTATNVAMIMTELGRAGFSVTQIEKMTSAVINMARASGTDAAVSAGIMSTAIRQFRLDASQATRVADSLTLAANATFNSVESLGEALSYAGPVAADFGMSLEDTLAIVGALGNVGIQGSEAGTAIRRLLIITGAESKKLEKIFGTSFRDSAGNALPLVDVLDKINSSTKNLSQNDRAKKLNEAFGLLGITSASALGKSAVDVKELRKQLGNAAGTAAETAAIMDSGFGGAARRVSGAIEGLSLSVGSSLEPTLKELSTTIVTVVNGVSTWVKNNPEAVTQIAKTTAGAFAAGPALLAVAGGFKAASIGATVLYTTMSSPIVLPAALVAFGSIMATQTEIGKDAIGTLRREIPLVGDAVMDASQSVSEGFSEMSTDMMDASEQAVGAWHGIVDAVGAGDLKLAGQVSVAGLVATWRTGMSLINDSFVVATSIVNSTWQDTTSAMQGVGEDLSAWFQTMWLDIKGFAYDAFNAINNKWDSVSGSIADKIIDISVATGVMTGNAEEIKQARREDTARRINTRDAAGQAEAVSRDAAKAGIEANRQAGQKGIEEARRQRQQQIEDERNAALLANDKAEKDAKKQLDDLRKRAAEKAKVAAENKPDKEPPKPDAPGVGGKGGTSSATDKAAGGTGDKSELQVSGLAASLTRGGTVQSPEERKAKAVQKTTAAVREQADAYEFLEAAAKSAADVAARAAKAAGKTADEQKKAAEEAAAAMRGKPLPDKPGKQPPITPAERKEQADFMKQWKRQYQSGKPNSAVASDGSPGVSFGQQSWSSQYGSNVPLPIPDLSGVTMPDISSPDRIGQPALEVKVDSSKQEELLSGVISELRSLRSIVTSTGGLA